MSFATQKDKPNSERFMLVKITPGRYVSTDLVSQGGGVYAMNWTYNIEKVQRNGVDLVKVSSTPSVNDRWHWNGSSLSIKLAAAPSATNVIVVFYNLFYTSGQYRITTVDPENIATEQIHWEPMLSDEPSVKQSVRDIINGTLSTALTTIRLINVDNEFQKYLTDNDSFYEKTVKCWLCINGVDNIQKAFEGRIKKIDLSKSVVTLTTYDIFSLLDQPAMMGDTAAKSYWIRQADSFPDMDPAFSGTPIKYIASVSSRYKEKPIEGSAEFASVKGYEPDSLERAVCTDYSDVESNSTNLTWGLCRLGASSLRLWSSSAQFSPTTVKVISVSPTNTSITRIASTTDYKHSYFEIASSAHNFEVGCSFSVRMRSTIDNSLINVIPIPVTVINNEEFTYSATTYRLAVSYNSSISVHTTNRYFENPPLYNSAPIVFIKRIRDNLMIPLIHGRDFTFSLTSTTGGNYYVEIELTDNIYDNVATDFHPRYYEVLYRVVNDGSNGHSNVLKKICDKSGLSTNAASFTAAQTALNLNTAFSIPQFDEPDFNSYRKYAEEICKSTMGILSANNSFELEYNLLAAPSSSNATTEDMYLKDSLSIDVDYQDIVTQMIAYNPHNSSQAAIDADPSPSETVSSAVAEHLHGIKNTVRFRHVLETITSRIQAIFDILSHRRAIYRFSTATDNLDSEIGDDLQLESSQILGGVASKDLKIISLDKSAGRADVEATDLLDI